MRQLPFDDASFDVVVSSLAIHNVPGAAARAKALREAARVLGRQAGDRRRPPHARNSNLGLRPEDHRAAARWA
jgi:ubiquinone/menaquinone biosynthesis C-methylase UbiE